MQGFTGSHKKTIAGSIFISCVMSMLFLCIAVSTSVYANDAAPENTAANQTTSVTSIQNQTTPESTVTETPPVSAGNITQTTSPVNTPKSVAPQKNSSASQLANLIGGLAIILVLIYGLSWFVKRFTQGGFMQTPSMKIISSMPLGTRERLMLVDVGGKQLLLGVTAAQINTLHVFDEPVVVAEKAQPAGSDFSQKLMAILQQKNYTPDDTAHKKSNS